MYQLDEKIMADNRAIISIARSKEDIDKNLKPGMFVYDSLNKDAYVVASKNVHHKFIKEQDDHKIHGNLIFADKIEFENGISILGDITNVETVDLLVSDNIIEINKDEMSSGISRLSAGIKINRGLLPHYYTLFNESSDRTSLGAYTHVIGEDVLSKLYSDGDMWLKKNLDVANLRVRESALIEKDFRVMGDSTFNQSVTIDGITDIKGSTVIDNTLSVAGAVNIFSTLDVQMNASMHQDLEVNKDLSVKGNTCVTGSLDIGGYVTVTGETQLNSNVFAHALDVLTNTKIQQNLSVMGTSSFGSKATMENDLSVLGDADVAGNTTLNTLNVTTTSQFDGASTFNSYVNIGSKLTTNELHVVTTSLFDQKGVFNDDLDVVKNFDVNGLTTINDLIVRTSANILGNLSVTDITANNIHAKGTLTVVDDGKFNKDLSVDRNFLTMGHTELNTLLVANSTEFNGYSTFNADVSINSNTAISENLSVEKTITADSINIKNQLNFYSSHVKYNTYEIVDSLFNSRQNSISTILDSKDDTIKHIILDKTVSEQSYDEMRYNTPVKVKIGDEWSQLLDEKTGHKKLHAAGGSDEILPSDINAVENADGVRALRSGSIEDIGIPNPYGEVYFCPDNKSIYFGKGRTWEKMGSVDWTEVLDKPETFTPPIATTECLGGVKIGKNIKVANDGTISVPNAVIEYNVHRKEFVTTRQTDTFITDVEFVPNSNLISVYVFGKILPPTAYTEVDKNTIVLKEPVDTGTHVEIVTLVIPSGALFSFKREEFFAIDDQVDFVLSNGQYLVGENKVKVYILGALLPPSAYTEVSYDRIRLKTPVEKGTHVMIEYLSDPEIASNRMNYAKSINYVQRSSTTNHPIYETIEERTVWEIIHNQGAYINIIPLSFEGYKLNPKTVQYVNSNIIRIYFDNPTNGRVMIG